MSISSAARIESKKVTITIPNVPSDLWQAFQEEAKRQNQNVGAFLVAVMAGAAGFGRPPEAGGRD